LSAFLLVYNQLAEKNSCIHVGWAMAIVGVAYAWWAVIIMMFDGRVAMVHCQLCQNQVVFDH